MKKWKRRLLYVSRPVRHGLMLLMMESFRLAAQNLPHGTVLWLGRGLGRLVWLLDARGRRRANRQLEQAGFGDRRGVVTRELYEQLGMNTLEWLHSIRWSIQTIREHVDFSCVQAIERIQSGGRAVIFVSAHLGNWELLPRAFHAYTGRSVAAVMAEQRDPLINDWLVRTREAGGTSRLLPVHDALGIFRHLRAGGALALLADQDSTRSRGVFVEFFGRPAYTPVGPAYLARRTGSPLLPVVIVRRPDTPHRHQVLLGEPIEPDKTLEELADIQRMTQAYTRQLEAWIRQYPAQWVWIHNRWRHRPGQKIRVRSARHGAARP